MLCVINNEVNITFEDCYYYLRSIFPCEIFSIETEYFSKPNHATNLSRLSYCTVVCFILSTILWIQIGFDASNKSFQIDEYIIVAQFPYFFLHIWSCFVHTKTTTSKILKWYHITIKALVYKWLILLASIQLIHHQFMFCSLLILIFHDIEFHWLRDHRTFAVFLLYLWRKITFMVSKSLINNFSLVLCIVLRGSYYKTNIWLYDNYKLDVDK